MVTKMAGFPARCSAIARTTMAKQGALNAIESTVSGRNMLVL